MCKEISWRLFQDLSSLQRSCICCFEMSSGKCIWNKHSAVLSRRWFSAVVETWLPHPMPSSHIDSILEGYCQDANSGMFRAPSFLPPDLVCAPRTQPLQFTVWDDPRRPVDLPPKALLVFLQRQVPPHQVPCWVSLQAAAGTTPYSSHVQESIACDGLYK